MKKNQLEKVNMFNVVALFFTANATLFQGFIKLVAEITDFITHKQTSIRGKLLFAYSAGLKLPIAVFTAQYSST